MPTRVNENETTKSVERKAISEKNDQGSKNSAVPEVGVYSTRDIKIQTPTQTPTQITKIQQAMIWDNDLSLAPAEPQNKDKYPMTLSWLNEFKRL